MFQEPLAFEPAQPIQIKARVQALVEDISLSYDGIVDNKMLFRRRGMASRDPDELIRSVEFRLTMLGDEETSYLRLRTNGIRLRLLPAVEM